MSEEQPGWGKDLERKGLAQSCPVMREIHRVAAPKVT